MRKRREKYIRGARDVREEHAQALKIENRGNSDFTADLGFGEFPKAESAAKPR